MLLSSLPEAEVVEEVVLDRVGEGDDGVDGMLYILLETIEAAGEAEAEAKKEARTTGVFTHGRRSFTSDDILISADRNIRRI